MDDSNNRVGAGCGTGPTVDCKRACKKKLAGDRLIINVEGGYCWPDGGGDEEYLD